MKETEERRRDQASRSHQARPGRWAPICAAHKQNTLRTEAASKDTKGASPAERLRGSSSEPGRGVEPLRRHRPRIQKDHCSTRRERSMTSGHTSNWTVRCHAIGEAWHICCIQPGARCDDPHLGRGWAIGAIFYADLGRLISLSRAAQEAPTPRTIDGALLALCASKSNPVMFASVSSIREPTCDENMTGLLLVCIRNAPFAVGLLR
jgi:hypothetical protein